MGDSFQFKVIQSRKDLYYSKIFTDVTLVSDDFGKFLAHKTILASASDWFKSLLHLSEDKTPVIHLKGVQKEELEGLLEYVYLGQLSVAGRQLENLKIIAKELGINVDEDYENVKKEPKKLQFLSNSRNEDSVFKTKTLNFLQDEKTFVEEEEIDFQPKMKNKTLDFLQDKNHFDEEVDYRTETLNFLNDENNFAKEIQAPDQELISDQQQRQTQVVDVNQFLSKPFNLSSLFFNGSGEENEETVDKEETERNSNEEVDENLIQEEAEGSMQSSQLSWGKTDDNRYKQRPKEDPSECGICGLITTTKRSMQRHHKTVHELRFRFTKCNICGKEVRGDSLSMHMTTVHFPKQYNCSQCDYTSKSTQGLKKHVRHIHIGIL